MTLSHEDRADPGSITYGLLQNTGRVTADLNMGPLDVYYSGDEPLGTKMVLTLSGVPNQKMGLNEVSFFERAAMKFLKDNAQSDAVEILSVKVEQQDIDDDALTALKISGNGRLMAAVTDTIDITTAVTGKHRPPSPGLDFDVLIEDSFNADSSTFKEELSQSATESGGDFFSNIEEVRATAAYLAPPTQPPTQELEYRKVDVGAKGLGFVANIGIIIGAAVFTFALVFGAFIFKKRRQEKSKFKLSPVDFDDEDEDDPLFYDMFKSKRNVVPPKSAFAHKHEVAQMQRLSACSSATEPETDNSGLSSQRISTREVVVNVDNEDMAGNRVQAVDKSKRPNTRIRDKSTNRSKNGSGRSAAQSASGSQYDLRPAAGSKYDRSTPQPSQRSLNRSQHHTGQYEDA